MKIRLILLGITFLIFGGGLAMGLLWDRDGQKTDWAPFGESRQQAKAVKLPVPEEITKTFSHDFSALHAAEQANPVPSPLAFSGKGGKEHKLSEFYGNGNYLLLNMWATWCAPCVLELPSLGGLKKTYEGKGLEVLSLSIDHARDLKEIETFLQTRGIGPFALYLDDERAVRSVMPARGIPTSYLISPDGLVLYIFEGDTDWTGAPAKAFFDALLAAKE